MKTTLLFGLVAMCAGVWLNVSVIAQGTTNNPPPIVISVKEYADFVAYRKMVALRAQRMAVIRSVQSSTNPVAMQIASMVLTNNSAASNAVSILNVNK